MDLAMPDDESEDEHIESEDEDIGTVSVTENVQISTTSPDEASSEERSERGGAES